MPTSETETTPETESRLWTRARVIQLALFTAAYFMSYFYGAANAVIAPNLSEDMNLDAAQLGFMTSLFWGVFTVVQLPIGWALDRWGARWVTPVLMLGSVDIST